MKIIIIFISLLLSFSVNSQHLNDYLLLSQSDSLSNSITQEEVKAFPGAQGYAKNTTGGRGGAVIKVTNLNDSGAGSFREAVSASNRIVVFEVAGYIDLLSTVTISSNITIAGQTAFVNSGQGITIRKSAVTPFAGPMLTGNNNTIIRYIRLRSGQLQIGDCCGDEFVAESKTDIIFDHCSFSYSSDEVLDFTNSERITIQNCIASEPLSEGIGGLSGKIFQTGPTRDITFYRNLIANSGQRNPALSPKDGRTANFEYINNYGFNLGVFGLTVDNTGTENVNINIMGNYWHSPSNLSWPRRWVMLRPYAGNRYYFDNNNYDSRFRPTNTGTAWNLMSADVTDFASNFTLPLSTTYQVLDPNASPIVLDNVPILNALTLWTTLQDDFGASIFRDAADIRVIAQINANNAPANAPSPTDENDFGTAYSALLDMTFVPIDANNDGIPDAWATANMPGGAAANDLAPSGYPWVEEYINQIN